LRRQAGHRQTGHDSIEHGDNRLLQLTNAAEVDTPPCRLAPLNAYDQVMVRAGILTGSVVLVLAMTVAAWYLAGFWHDLRNLNFVDPDYFIRPFPISKAAERIIGVSAVLVTVAAGSWLTWASVQHSFDLRWWSVLGPLVASAALIGFAWRVFTAQVIGATSAPGASSWPAGRCCSPCWCGRSKAPSP